MLLLKQTMTRLTDVFRDVFDDDSLNITPNTTADDIEDWDSIEHITLIGAVEDEFGMKFKMGEVSGMNNVGDMLKIVMERGK
ncbi:MULTISPECIES: acyl carrier protein [Ruminococcus]|uniref:Acyl carrier protein n=1 Tax=Ruminococcus albus (strain ATCC 27210 / DSM 20455 / JCM 14654 / NCDO 2250 / 7) TaxID=697329 RepID=E6UCG8_RUMA7|nr:MULTISPECIES: acyl carrier protein [Ruminococcus]ADU20760.1 acyl carrier protein [Ruminococcus albus 7 = DSM 20455]MCR5021882.1 acyl carrier protein [Ruminococcus sp.]